MLKPFLQMGKKPFKFEPKQFSTSITLHLRMSHPNFVQKQVFSRSKTISVAVGWCLTTITIEIFDCDKWSRKALLSIPHKYLSAIIGLNWRSLKNFKFGKRSRREVIKISNI